MRDAARRKILSRYMQIRHSADSARNRVQRREIDLTPDHGCTC